MTNRRRIISVQGPFNLLSVLSHLFAERGQSGFQPSEDTLVVHGLHAGDDTTQIHAVISDMARVWDWRRIVFLADFEKNELKNVTSVTPEISTKLQELLGLANIDEIFVVRNWQFTNELLLKTFSSAKKILYGDAFGQIDSYSSPHYAAFDEGRYLLPLRYFPHSTEERIIDANNLPYRISPRASVLAVIEKYLEISPQARSIYWELGRDAHKKIILLTKNATESRVVQLETEIAIYVDAVLKLAKPGVQVLIKPHPREALGQSKLVQRVLKELHGLECTVVGTGTYLGHMPVEVLCHKNNFLAVIAPLVSVTCRQLKYLFDMDSYEALNDEMLARINPARAYHYLATDLVNRETVRRLSSWNGEGMVYEWNAEGDSEKKQLARSRSVVSQWPHLRDVGSSEISAALQRLSTATAGNSASAIVEAVRALLDLEPADVQLALSLADFGERAGDADIAERGYSLAVTLDPYRAESHKKYSAALAVNGRERQAKIAEACAVALADRAK